MLAIVLTLTRGLNGNHAHAPLLLFDEPTSGLQPDLVEETFDQIHRISQRPGAAVVLTEQHPGAERIATHHYHIERGHLS